MNQTLIGIVLDRSDYKEHDALMRVITKEFGVITWIAKGVNKPKSKYNGLLQPFVELEALVDIKPTISLFKNATSLNRHASLSESLEVLAMASFISKILSINASIDNRLLSFDMYKTYLEKITPDNYVDIGTHFLMKLAEDMGIKLYLDGCVVCQRPQVVGISLQAGGFLCQTHLTDNHYHIFNKEFLKQLRCLSKASLAQISQCTGTTTLQHMELYVSLLSDILKIPMKNWHFINQI